MIVYCLEKAFKPINVPARLFCTQERGLMYRNVANNNRTLCSNRTHLTIADFGVKK